MVGRLCVGRNHLTAICDYNKRAPLRAFSRSTAASNAVLRSRLIKHMTATPGVLTLFTKAPANAVVARQTLVIATPVVALWAAADDATAASMLKLDVARGALKGQTRNRAVGSALCPGRRIIIIFPAATTTLHPASIENALASSVRAHPVPLAAAQPTSPRCHESLDVCRQVVGGAESATHVAPVRLQRHKLAGLWELRRS